MDRCVAEMSPSSPTSLGLGHRSPNHSAATSFTRSCWSDRLPFFSCVLSSVPRFSNLYDPESTFRMSTLRSSEKCSASLKPLDSAQLLFPLGSHLSSSCASSSSSHRGQRGSRAQGQAEKRKWMGTGLSLPWGQKPGVSPGKAILVRRPPGHYFKTASGPGPPASCIIQKISAWGRRGLSFPGFVTSSSPGGLTGSPPLLSANTHFTPGVHRPSM